MLYTHTRTHMHPHSIGTSYLLPTCAVLVHVYVFCNTFKKSHSSLISIIILAVKSLQATLVQNSCPSAQEAKALGLALEPFLICQQHGASGAALCSLNPGMKRQYMLELELPLYDIDRLPIKFTTSPSPRAGDVLPSEQGISSSFCLKSSERFLKAQIYILWFWPFFRTVSHSWNSFPLLWSKQPPIFI